MAPLFARDVVEKYMERCQSGRMELTANELSLVRGTLGSNPSLSAKNHLIELDDLITRGLRL